MDRDVVTARIATIDRCLERIAVTRTQRRSLLRPVEVEDIVAAFFSVLERHGLIGPGLGDRRRRRVGFRNIAVHEYQDLDLEVVKAMVTRHLGDRRELSARAVARSGL